MKVQSILISKDLYSLDTAIKWLIKNNFKFDKVDITDNYFRFRQITPNPIYNYKTIDITQGIKFIMIP
jgi:hypothetical protein